MDKQSTVDNSGYFIQILKAVIIAVIVSLVGILILAVVIKVFSLDTELIPIINQIIKVVSIFIACMISFKLTKDSAIRGIVVGAFYTVLCFGIFSALAGEFVIGLSLLFDVAIGSLVGFISGIISRLIR